MHLFLSSRLQGKFQEIYSSSQFDDPVESMAINSNDQLIATSHKGKIECWDVGGTDWKLLWSRELLNGIPRALSFDPTGRTIYLFTLEQGDRQVFYHRYRSL